MKTKAWITQYALTDGIEEYQSVEVDEFGDAWIPNGNTSRTRFVRAVHVHLTLDSAMTRAEKMRNAKYDSLRRQAERITELHIRVVQR
jgi:penicillin V acylase-like amidase (Ntn superfamily)